MSFLFGTSNQTTTTKNMIDPGTQAYLDAYRKSMTDRSQLGPGAMGEYRGLSSDMASRGLGFGMQTGMNGVENYFNPYEENVIGGIRGDFDQQRGYASRAAADQAVKDHAFGGGRSAILQARMMGDVNRNEASTIAQFRNQGYNTASGQLMADRDRMSQIGAQGFQGLFNTGQYDLNALNGLNNSFQFGNTTQEQTVPYHHDVFGQLLGLGGTIAGAALGGPAGASVGSKLGGAMGGGGGYTAPSQPPTYQPFGYNQDSQGFSPFGQRPYGYFN